MLIEDFLAELKQQLAELSPELAGIRNFQRLDVEPNTAHFLANKRVEYERREQLIAAAVDRLERLLNDGYPDIEPFEVSQDIYSNLVREHLENQAFLSNTKQPGEPESTESSVEVEP